VSSSQQRHFLEITSPGSELTNLDRVSIRDTSIRPLASPLEQPFPVLGPIC
jgi:hypothetical protein